MTITKTHSASDSHSGILVTVYTMENCPFCMQAKRLLTQRGVAFQEILVPISDDQQWDALYERSGMRTMPQIFFKKLSENHSSETLVGGYQELKALDQEDQLESLKKQ
jgi:glutaredoxin 3